MAGEAWRHVRFGEGQRERVAHGIATAPANPHGEAACRVAFRRESLWQRRGHQQATFGVFHGHHFYRVLGREGTGARKVY